MSKIHFDSAQATQLLTDGCAQMQLPINAEQTTQLIAYLQLMAKWNPVYNLTAIRTTDKMVSHHLLDSLAVLPEFEKAIGEHPLTLDMPKILDVGSGGGLPGAVLAIMRSDWLITLIDPVHKKTAFLTQVKTQLKLDNLSIITGKVEDLPTAPTYQIITSRAFASLCDFVQLAQHVLADDGCFLAMKGVVPDEEIKELQQKLPSHRIQQVQPIQVAQLEGSRHLIRIQPQHQAGKPAP